MTKLSTTPLACAIFLALCSLANANVFGTDRRVILDPAAFPLHAIGLVRQIEGDHVREICTGTLIGQRLVLTASHCVAREGEALSSRVATVFSRPTSEKLHSVVAFWSGAWRKETDPRGGDWAILLLDSAVNSEGGTLPVVAQIPHVGQRLALLGYSIDRGNKLTADFGCQVRLALPEGVFHHDCGVFAGASGGPIFSAIGEGRSRHWLIVGVQSAHKSDGTIGLHLAAYDSAHANLGTSARGFLMTVQRLRTRYEPLIFNKTTKVASFALAR